MFLFNPLQTQNTTMEISDKTIKIDEKSELGEVFENLDKDIVDEKTKMTTIDFNTKLSDIQISNSMVIDEFIRLGILPNDTGITRQIKRLSVSKDGWGRDGKVKIVVGDREREKGGSGFMSRLFGRRGGEY